MDWIACSSRKEGRGVISPRMPAQDLTCETRQRSPFFPDEKRYYYRVVEILGKTRQRWSARLTKST